jgi:thiopurine S-methyltransferase
MKQEQTHWHARWREGRIGFHEGVPNSYLVAHHAEIASAKNILVPLCGKSFDMLWLAQQGHHVVGVELVESAVLDFFAQNHLVPRVTKMETLTRYENENITIFAGDFFATTPALLGTIDGVYDRAALIALPPELRGPYVKHMRSLLSQNAVGIVIAVEYDQAQMSGPPFSVLETEVRQHFTGCEVQLLAQGDAQNPRFNAVKNSEKCFRIKTP